MARKPVGLPPGVEIRGDALRIRFTWNGERRGETLAHPPTAQGIKAASRLRDQVVNLIKHGLLDEEKYADLFPGSDLALSAQAAIPSFGEYAQLWLDSRHIVGGTRNNYKSSFNLYWMPYLGLRRIDMITPTMLRGIIANIEWSSTGVKRNAIIKLASVFKTAVLDGLIAKNPTSSLDKPKAVKKVVDPYTRDEAERIIAHLYKTLHKYSQIYAPFFEFAFFTGLRPGEAMGLQWDDIDLEARTANIRRIIVDGQPEDRTKTKHHRVILLNERALHALRQAQRLADLRRIASKSATPTSPFVFQPGKGGMWIREPSVTIKHFKLALKALGIRERRQYDTRHTYATMCLMAGMNPAFIANQLGHSVEMLLSTYAKWISSSSDWRELEKLPARV
ncbi:tyrosine-type recombinase/integrase [Pseudomonas donghuensis]|uniref:Tyrosine-type recombinase/integrase n=1 Tax=Pseudomonas donghuensis TaxID=1163398 RepID=A0AAP0SHR0_9PSED|nr:tyrosine-type recombinase/integrase [Pseudomonas donghuensis]KDN98959.1 tyrosine-type recombinase/integrase [Pseudomonas donghuensis]MCP6691295.1 tyrosine-type recombinase/integrase [Pseudomonas donghuensis]